MKDAGAQPGFRVWDLVVRFGHWGLVGSVAAAWWTRAGGAEWHERIGYLSLALVALRLVWGWAGTRYARFSQFVRSPVAVLRYAGQVWLHKEPRHLGHNPLGGWMIVALLLNIALVGATGWLYTTDEYWGVKWVDQLHYALAVSLLVLVALHVCGVIVASRRHRENLVAAMVHGAKRPPVGDDVA